MGRLELGERDWEDVASVRVRGREGAGRVGWARENDARSCGTGRATNVFGGYDSYRANDSERALELRQGLLVSVTKCLIDAALVGQR